MPKKNTYEAGRDAALAWWRANKATPVRPDLVPPPNPVAKKAEFMRTFVRTGSQEHKRLIRKWAKIR